MRVKQDSLGILGASVVLEGTAVQTGLFAQTCYSLSVVVSESVHLEDTLGYVRGAHEVNLEELGLEVGLVGSVISQGFKQEGGRLLNTTVLKEYLDN
jgi:hypothetical protein